MNRSTLAFIVVFIGLFALIFPEQSYPQEKPPTFEVYFSPRGGCTEAIIRELNKAKKTVLVQAYKITSLPIAKALTQAHARGITVDVILDKSQRTDKYSSATFLFNHGVQVRIDAKHHIQHNKVMVIDGETVITGSFNFTPAAEESNAENLLIIRDRKLAEIYEKNFEDHKKHSSVYEGRGK